MTSTKEKIVRYLKETLGDHDVAIPESLIDFWSTYYGQPINKTMTDVEGQSWHMDSVLTVDSREEVNPTEYSWRNSSSPAALDYSVPYLESVLSNWEEHDRLIPIMAIESQERAEFDLVVINLVDNQKLKISIWVHEENDDSDEPYLVDLAENWDDFYEKWIHADEITD